MDKADVKANVEKRLKTFGYTVVSADEWVLNFLTEKVEKEILNNCNISEIPNELMQIEVDMICGEFLLFMKNSGKLELENFDFETVEKSIQEGDVKVEFYVDGTMTNEQKFDNLVNSLVSGHKNILTSYRCIKW